MSKTSQLILLLLLPIMLGIVVWDEAKRSKKI